MSFGPNVHSFSWVCLLCDPKDSSDFLTSSVFNLSCNMFLQVIPSLSYGTRVFLLPWHNSQQTCLHLLSTCTNVLASGNTLHFTPMPVPVTPQKVLLWQPQITWAQRPLSGSQLFCSLRCIRHADAPLNTFLTFFPLYSFIYSFRKTYSGYNELNSEKDWVLVFMNDCDRENQTRSYKGQVD